MGANFSVAENKVTQSILQELSQTAGVSANASCDVSTGQIRLHGNYNKVNSKNMCGASASASLGAVASATAKAIESAKTQQETVLPLLGVNANASQQQIQSEISTILNQKCQANSNLQQEIINDGIDIYGNYNEIDNINTGTAVGNCGIMTVMSAVQESYAESEAQQSTGNVFGAIGNMFKTGGIYMLMCYCICCCICCILLIMVGVGGYMFTQSENSNK